MRMYSICLHMHSHLKKIFEVDPAEFSFKNVLFSTVITQQYRTLLLIRKKFESPMVSL